MADLRFQFHIGIRLCSRNQRMIRIGQDSQPIFFSIFPQPGRKIRGKLSLIDAGILPYIDNLCPVISKNKIAAFLVLSVTSFWEFVTVPSMSSTSNRYRIMAYRPVSR